METILAPTDFSKASKNAINYAAQLAKINKAGLILLHAYLPPVMVSDVPVMIPFADEIEKKGLKKLKIMAANLRAKYGKALKIEVICKYGSPAPCIMDIAKEKKCKLIVMGLQGTGFIEERITGSTTTDLIKKSEVPVLSIGDKIKYKKIKRIVFATDFLQLKKAEILNPLKEMAATFKSHIYILHVTPENLAIPTITEAVQGIKLDRALEGSDHSFHNCINNKVSEGINEFVKTFKIDMVVMISRNHSILHSIFNKRETKAVAFQSTIPLLTFQE